MCIIYTYLYTYKIHSIQNSTYFTYKYVLLLLLSRFSHVRLCATPQTAALPGSSVPGIEIIEIIRCGLPWRLSGKESICQCRIYGFDPWVGKTPWRSKWQPTSLSLPGKSHGQRSLEGYSPWCCKRVGHDLVTEQQYITCYIRTIYTPDRCFYHLPKVPFQAFSPNHAHP